MDDKKRFETRDLINLQLDKISKNAMLITDFTAVYEWKDDTRTNNVLGYRGEFVIISGEAKGYKFFVNFKNMPSAELMETYDIDFDDEQSFVYATKNKYGLQAQFWANALTESL